MPAFWIAPILIFSLIAAPSGAGAQSTRSQPLPLPVIVDLNQRAAPLTGVKPPDAAATPAGPIVFRFDPGFFAFDDVSTADAINPSPKLLTNPRPEPVAPKGNAAEGGTTNHEPPPG